MSSYQCEAITKAGTRCTRNAEPNSNFCWQHDNYLNDLPEMIVQYIINPYLNFKEDISKLEQLTEVKYKENPHKTIVEYFWDEEKTKVAEREELFDGILTKRERWNSKGSKIEETYYTEGGQERMITWFRSGLHYKEQNSKNGISHGKTTIYHIDGRIHTEEEYENGNKIN
jgi:antitoxin component YwqK of YwqJK toxin-antitoxin module